MFSFWLNQGEVSAVTESLGQAKTLLIRVGKSDAISGRAGHCPQAPHNSEHSAALAGARRSRYGHSRRASGGFSHSKELSRGAAGALCRVPEATVAPSVEMIERADAPATQRAL
jgi:hypothetical protein